MDKNSKSEKNNSKTETTDYVTAGVVGAVAGAVSAVLATAMLDKPTRAKLGKSLVDITDKVIERVKNIDQEDPKTLKSIDSPKNKD